MTKWYLFLDYTAKHNTILLGFLGNQAYFRQQPCYMLITAFTF